MFRLHKIMAMSGSVLLLMNVMACSSSYMAKGPDEENLSSGKKFVLNPELSKEQEKELALVREDRRDCAGPFPQNPIAVSAFSHGHFSVGGDQVLSYPYKHVDEGNAWHSNRIFKSPCAGLYFFTVSFEKDSYYTFPPNYEPVHGTTDDVWVYLRVNGQNHGMAWSGEGDGFRGTGTDNIILRLEANQIVMTFVHADGNRPRHLMYHSFTAHRIGN